MKLLDAISIEVIKTTLSTTQIDSVIAEWKEAETADIESRARRLSDHLPREAKLAQAAADIEKEAEEVIKLLS